MSFGAAVLKYGMYVSSSTYGSSSFLPYEWTVRDNYVTSQHGDHFGSKIFVPNPKCSLFILYGLKQLINEPTRVTKFSSTLIDLIYTNYTDRVGCSEVSNIAISDHIVVYVYRRLSSDLPYFPSLTEIFEILIVKNFEMKCLRKTGRSINQKIQICYGLTEKQNFCAFLTHMLLFELDVLN